MKRGFSSQKGSRVGRDVKEKKVSMADKSVEGRKHVNVGLEWFPTVSEAHGIQSSACNEENMNDVGNTEGTTPAGNTPGKSSYANVIGESSKKAVNIRTLFTPRGTGLMLLCCSTDGLNSMLENGPWFIRNHPLILRKWNPDVDLLKEDVGNVPVWVKLHGIPVMAFSEDGLSTIATKLGTPLMLDSYTSDMCLQSWGMSSYARVMIELQADMELKDNIVVAMPKIMAEGYYTCTVHVEYEWKPLRCSCCVLVGPKVGFKPHKEYRPVPKKPTASPSGNKKKGVAHTNEVSNSNPFDALNSVDNVVEFGTNGGTTNLVNNGANSSGSSFMNIKNSSTSYTPIIDKIEKFEDLLIDGQAILVDEAGNPLKKVYDSEDEVASVDNDMTRSLASERVGFSTQSLLEQCRDSYGNGDYDEDPYDDDMYEGHDLPQEIQAICDNLDIRVRGRKKK
ncbi:RNA-directed DNA polymerase, eukaryota, reverse transcriptase zinc-binding domain protein [Tanacetum coccineum]